ncbi:hypothetical protein [Streptomyces sp. UNOC14_S4]|uniref:hypothetical protein n=1 Tax=Streptomyces sp. UNOC14_S4 TaxID=2872340 RepID=UPI001E28F707|nr:hypothetical protein [Streptomyces sp. UNOC14_S4]MCC3769613.1 hypothetical protein [Streptomyces sp. UNOC14_S4]
MSFEEEWAQHKADAAKNNLAPMHLNTASTEPGRDGSDPSELIVRADDLGGIGHDAYELHDHLRKAGDVARGAEGVGATAGAATELKRENFATGAALSTTIEVWNSQLHTLMQACATISNHLDFSVASHNRDDVKVATSMSCRDGRPMPVSEISKYFN